MSHEQLTEEDVRKVLERAESLQRAGGASLEALLAAGQEAGLSRETLEAALREHARERGLPPEPGELAFAKSADGKHYVAEVLAVNGLDARVRFLNGGEHSLPVGDLRPARFLPGERISCPFPTWGWCPATVLSFDPTNREVEVQDAWDTHRFPIAKVRWEPPRERRPLGRAKALLLAYALGLASGGLLMALLSRLLTR
ncbi:MAG: hypothetical protein KIS66_05355 [Fimbriimonadaceae bacterium]|nr:hypothetical protein [Fimbriimonadaceae bacterium]